MEKPSKLLLKLSQRLFEDAAERELFIDRLLHPKPFPSSILWCSEKPAISPFEVESPLSWQPPFVDRLAIGQKPGQDPLHHAGAFYCLDFSSVFAVSPLLTVPPPVNLVMDVCASPGGKSIFAWVALHPQRLLSNEVIGKRTAQLIANLKRCQVNRAIVLRLDAKVLAAEIPQTAQVVLVDAPCTGQSLMAKGGKAPGCFHPVTINGNANRQKRILANSAQLVAPQGYLAYMTCTYSPEENEQVADWFLERFPQFQAIAVPPLMPHQSHLTKLPCYRMFPQQNLGAGAFTILFQNTEGGAAKELPEGFLEQGRGEGRRDKVYLISR
ncbi:RsmB/NOP family class I SAM-dependent RNA methyltransferase [Kovacikia minuta CCNUW1]|uniref:RsmB/NOP family class I SAM-dependent RNA methyltransferase n=1 Tax=Kovacikia minuta TaxID=2931930 RepID=UPI001CCEA43B|nr:RsmB/NOP family class I SAM-dependent RNA methyltransferase [Kovacikia minuta]UBF27444.1 RsmB/NOP family class I SAM-dependent RNA methyltransferase [Kovacikia minuta CCNUW1]